MQGHLHSWQGPHKRLAMALLGTLGAIAFWIGGVSAQEAYPNKPVKIIVGMPAGSFTDLSARLIGDGLRHELNESFIVENRPGAATNIATQSVARSGKDGYTLLLSTNSNAMNVSLFKDLPFDVVKDFTPVAMIASSAFILAVTSSLPADIAIFAAAVADWRVAEAADQKMKKNGKPPSLKLAENPDILKTLSQPGNRRPALVIGFAAETQDIVRQARAKLARKGCDWILANDVSPASGTFGGDSNTIHLVEVGAVEDWPALSKRDVAQRLAQRIGAHFAARGGK